MPATKGTVPQMHVMRLQAYPSTALLEEARKAGGLMWPAISPHSLRCRHRQTCGTPLHAWKHACNDTLTFGPNHHAPNSTNEVLHRLRAAEANDTLGGSLVPGICKRRFRHGQAGKLGPVDIGLATPHVHLRQRQRQVLKSKLARGKLCNIQYPSWRVVLCSTPPLSH